MSKEAVLVIWPLAMKNIKINPVAKVMMPSLTIFLASAAILTANIADNPNIPAKFHIFEPITVPTPNSVLPVKEAISAEPNSGKDVPIAAAVTPKIICEIPKDDPISTMLSTNISEDFISDLKEYYDFYKS